MGGIDKLFAPLAGAPLLAHTVEIFLGAESVDRIVLVLHSDRLEKGRRLSAQRGWGEKVHLSPGGPRRQDSVRLGLEQLPGEGWVLIHDGARPMATRALILKGLEAAVTTGAAIPGVPVNDTIKLVRKNVVKETLLRDLLRSIQTPQVFRMSLIHGAHQKYAESQESFTDDAALLEALGWPVAVFAGETHNIKVTTPEDLRRVEQLWNDREPFDG
jgi:2-C-methyl-D-erythritol 4-phosphate cytidylyltransferase